MNKDLPKQAVIYCRSASQPQSTHDVVIIRQEDSCKAYAKKHGIEVLEVFRDSCTIKPEEITEAFKMVGQACGSEIVDIPAIDEGIMLRRLKHEASREQLLIDVMAFMQKTHEQTAKFWDRICDVTEAGEEIR